jgi:acetyl-CoA carboxylase biotin carboxyl carrier protein
MNEAFIVTLIEKFGAAGITELEFNEGNFHLVLRKNVSPPDQPHCFDTAVSAARGSPESAESPAGAAAGAVSVEVNSAGGHSITSPIVGTFYPAPGPDAPPFVRPGSQVKAGDTLCILEAMKMMNHLEAEFDCEISAVKAASGDLVEYGQVLFEVKRL